MDRAKVPGFLLLGLLVSPPAFGSVSFEIHPYLIRSGTGALMAAWRYEGLPPPGTPALRFFRGGRATGQVTAVEDHGLFLADLPIPSCGFGADAAYQVSGMDQPESIVELPCGGDEAVRFTFMADTQLHPDIAHRFALEMVHFPGSFILHGGDTVQRGSVDAEWSRYFAAFDAVGRNRVTIPALGNHEYRGRLAGESMLWERYFQTRESESHYSVAAGPARIFVINSNFEQKSISAEEEAAWLDAELSQPAQWKIVAFHHPPYSRSIAQAPLPFLTQEHVVLRKLFVPLFEQHGVQLVLNGHTHLYETAEKNGVHYVTTGAAGGRMGLIGAANAHVHETRMERTMIHVEATPETLHVLTVNIDGKPVDDLVLSAGASADRAPAFASASRISR